MGKLIQVLPNYLEISDCSWTWTHNHLVHKRTLNHLAKMVWPIWLYDWVFIYELSDFGFESSSSHLNFRFRACSEQGVSWHSGNCRVWIYSEMRTWHDKNIQYLEINFCYNFRLWQGGQLVFNLWTQELFLIFVGTGKINEKCRLSFE